MLCFGKKLQVCGLMASKRIDEVEGNVFQKRVASTPPGREPGGHGSGNGVLEIIQEEDLVGNAARMGEVLLQGLHRLGSKHSGLIANVPRRGCCAHSTCPQGRSATSFGRWAMKRG